MADLPEWRAFDGNAAPILPEHAERPGRLVAVVATERAREDGWAIDATVDIVRAWSESGRVVLADTALEVATLHEALGTDNAEGVTDAVLFGSSVQHVVKPTDGAFFIMTAGTATADPGAVLASERWRRLCRGFVEAGVTLVTYVGAESDGKSAILEMATDVVLLAGSTEDAWTAVNGAVAPIRAVIGPASTAPSDMPPGGGLADGLDPLVGEVEGENQDATPAIMPARAALSGLTVAEASIGGAARGSIAPVATGSRPVAFFVVGVIVLAVVVAAVLGWIDIPGLSP